MAHIDKKKDGGEHLRFPKITLDHLPPFFIYRFCRLGIAIAGEIHQVELIIDIIKIQSLRLSGHARSPCKRLSSEHSIDKGRLSDI